MILIEDLEKTLSTWMAAIEHYSLEDLKARPDPAGWSIGQVFMHLVEETRFYMGEMEACLLGSEHGDGEMIDRAKAMFANNEFPDERVVGDPFVAAQVRQPVSLKQLRQDWQSLRSDLMVMARRITSSASKGKTRHPGLGYFSAQEWLQYADMHLRHHLRQKKRLDESLKIAR